jgi:hypothetical protein
MLHALCPSHSPIRNPHSEIESGCILYHEWLYSLVRLHIQAQQSLGILLLQLLNDIMGFSLMVLLCFRF